MIKHSRMHAVLIGWMVFEAALAHADQSNDAAGRWESAAPLPEARTEVSTVSDGKRIYLLGGFGQDEDGRAIAPRSVYAYDPDQGSWLRIAELPAGVNHAGLVYHDGSLFVVAGFREASFDPVDNLSIYDLGTGRWRSGPRVPTGRGALAVVVHDRRIHAIGGVDANGENTGAHEIFDPATERWRLAAPLPEPRNHIGAATVGDRIIVVAGRDDTSATQTFTHIYDPLADQWREGAPVPTGRSGVAAVSFEGFIYVFGGEGFEPEGTFDNAERYDPARDRWEVLPPMLTARHGLGAAVLDGRIHVISGGLLAGMTFSDAHEVLSPPN